MESKGQLGIGGIVVADSEEGWVKESEFPRILDFAIDRLGATYIDTARGYDRAEEVIGRWRRASSRRGIRIGSKVGVSRLKEASELAAHFETSLQTTLKKLGLKQLELYWLHSPSSVIPLETIIERFADAIERNLVETFGVSNVSNAEIEQVFEICERRRFPKPVAVQNEFNLVSAKESAPARELCSDLNLKFYGFSPLASGLLAGRYPAVDAFPPGTRWSGWKNSRSLPPYWTSETFEKLRELDQRAKDRGVSMAAFGLRYCMNEIDFTLLGPRTVEQLKPAIEALALEFTEQDNQFLKDRFE